MRLNTAASAGFFSSVPVAFGEPSAFRKYAAMSGDCAIKRSAAIKLCKRGEMAKPCSDRRIAGSNSLAHGKWPLFLCAISRARNTPGVPTERPPICASVNAIGVPSAFRNRRSVAPAGAVSRPS